jgi:Uma2 family endonuclease
VAQAEVAGVTLVGWHADPEFDMALDEPVVGSAEWSRKHGPLDADAFLSFIKTRPDDERWELIDGVAVLQDRPTLVHQRIAKNLMRLLDDGLERVRPDLTTLQEVGLLVPGFEGVFRPECDVAVLPERADYESYSRSYFLAAEVLSDSNSAKHIAQKRKRYLRHPDNLYVLVIQQYSIAVDVWARRTGWRRERLERPESALTMPEFDFSHSISALYRGTPLEAGQSTQTKPVKRGKR